jgi:hypothetical protein
MLLRFAVIPTLCILGSVVALPTTNQPQDTTVILRSLKNVEGGLTRLVQAIKNIDPRMPSYEVARRWPELDRQCHEVSNILWEEARTVRRAPVVNVLESASLFQPITNLETLTSKVVDQWIAIKPAINVSDRKMVQDMLKDHQTAAGQYAEALISVQSSLSTPVGRLLGAGIDQQIQRGINAYKY